MNVENKEIAQRLIRRMAQLREEVPGSIGDLMDYRMEDWDETAGWYKMSCQTMPWMRNYAGILHGGMCATVVDQAMGYMSDCIRPEHSPYPTVQMSVDYFRPITPGDRVLVTVQIVAVTKRFIRLRAEVARECRPEAICLSATATYYDSQQ